MANNSAQMLNNKYTCNANIVSKVKELFQIQLDLTEINFTFMERKKYCANENKDFFGRNARSLICTIEFEIFYVPFTVKILYFERGKSYEILKLDIDVLEPLVLKEIEYCKNYLQRRRNVNLLFLTLVQFTNYIEQRRFIVDYILKKNKRILIKDHNDGGIVVEYINIHTSITFGLHWKIQWKTNHTINDIIEVYYRELEVTGLDEMKVNLVKLTHPTLPLPEKYKTWKALLNIVDNYNNMPIVTYDLTNDRSHITDRGANANMSKMTHHGVVLISDSEDEFEEMESFGTKRKTTTSSEVNQTYDIVVLE